MSGKTKSGYNPENIHLEPRVAKLEGTMDAIATNLRDLTGLVREQGQQMQALVVAVTTATGPHKTDYGVAISAVFLVITIGSLVLYPMGKELNVAVADLREHQRLTLHPVGESRINALEVLLKDGRDRNSDSIRELDAKLQKETQLTDSNIRERVAELQKQLDDVRLNGAPANRERLSILEEKLKSNGHP